MGPVRLSPRSLLGAALVALTGGVWLVGPPAGAAGRGHVGARPHSAAPTLTVTPTAALVDGQRLSVVATGVTPTSVYVAVDCGPKTISLLEDGCDSRHDTVLAVDGSGVTAGTLPVEAVLDTADGPVDCRTTQCFVALFSLYTPSGSLSLLLQNISFGPAACATPGACQAPQSRPGPTGAGRSPRAGPPTVTPGSPATLTLPAGPAGDLTAAGAVTGPYTAALSGAVPPVSPVTGEGILRLALDAPGTSWGPGPPSSVVVDVAVDGGPPQQLVLFDGATPFVYAGFTGPLTTGTHTVSVAVDSPLSRTGASTPSAEILDAELQVVDPANPSSRAYAYAPVMYGRSTSALHDTPLVESASAQPLGGGATRLTYTEIWSHEDAGTGFVPFLEWGEWGRITDIETFLTFTVAADGTVSNASYLWSGEALTGALDSLGATQETDVPFTGSFDGHHPILRDATGNNDFSDQGATAFRFQPALVDPPAPGQAREAVMDANPWTYEIMGLEVARWYGDVSTDPRSPQPGDARQYAVVDLDTSGSGFSAVGVDLQLSGDPTWYGNDQGIGYPLTGTGHVRTVVKLPPGWQGRTVTGVRLQAYDGGGSTLQVHSLAVEELAADWTLSTLSTPTPQVVYDSPTVAPALTVTVGPPTTSRPGGIVPGRAAQVTDALGEPLAGVPLTFAAGPDGGLASCGDTGSAATTGPDGTASSLPLWAGPLDGTMDLTATTAGGTATLAVPVAGPPSVVTGDPLLAGSDGGVFACGSARFEGSRAGGTLAAPVVAVARTPDRAGTWLDAADGGVFAYGDAPFHGSAAGLALRAPIVAMAPTPDGAGYWLVGADGGVFAYGDAPFHGSATGLALRAPIVAMAPTPDGAGYRLAGADGGIFAYGDVSFLGSAAGLALAGPVVAISDSGDSGGYRLAAADGGIFAFGDAPFVGSMAGRNLATPIVAMAP